MRPRGISGGQITPTALANPDYPPPAQSEPFWPAQSCVVAAIVLQLVLPKRLTLGPTWMLPALEAALLIGMSMATPRELVTEHRVRRGLALSLTALVSAANVISLGLLSHYLLRHGSPNGRELITSGVLIWLTNVLIFALWYWEVDRGGPGSRAAGHDGIPDLLFVQMTAEEYAPTGWRPKFIDYLYLSLTNATAFSPTDTMPLTGAAKTMMGVQSLVSLVVIGLVVSRAVNILQ